MEKLKVGDKVFIKKHHRFNGVSYILSEVERLTKTQAVLKNGTKLINEPLERNWEARGVFYPEYGDRYEKWWIPKESDIEEMNNHLHEKKIFNWYHSNKDKFTKEDLEKIYNLFNNLKV